MRQVAAHAQVKTQDGIAGLEDGQHQGGIGLRAAMRLYIRVFAIEDLFQPVDGQLFYLVHDLTTTIISPARITLRILIGQHRPHGLHHRQGSEIFRSDQFNPMALPRSNSLSNEIKNQRIFLHAAKIGTSPLKIRTGWLKKNKIHYFTRVKLDDDNKIYMKAIIPVAGAGTKLRPHTYTQPKALIPLAGKTILSIIVDQLMEAGITEFIFIVGYLGEKIQDFVKQKYPQLTAHFVYPERTSGHRPCRTADRGIS
jgi:hypothetical protein